MRSSLVPTPAPHLAGRLGVDLRLDGDPVKRPLLELAASLAVDRPDRIEATLRLDGSSGGTGGRSDAGRPLASAGRSGGAPRPGQILALAIGQTHLASGIVDRVTVEWSAYGRTLGVVAYAEYHHRRRVTGPRGYFETTDAEIAVDAAGRLGLVARVDPTREVRRRARVEGDPLRDLRRRARARGFHLAVADGRLHFLAETPPAATEFAIGGRDGILGLEIAERGSRGRGGSVEVRGDPRLRPLAAIDLCGIDSLTDGRYRVVRAVHRLDADGYVTRIEILETGIDIAAWSEGPQGAGEAPGERGREGGAHGGGA